MPFDIGGFVYDTTLIRNYTKGGIVTDGLVLHLDAAYGNSYPKGGTTWYDLSGNSNNGTLTNGPTYNGGNGGYISFDGSDDYVDGNVGTLNAPFTFEVFGKFNTETQYNYEYFGSIGSLSANSMISISKIGTRDSNSSYHGFMYVYPGFGDAKKTNINLKSTSYQHLVITLLPQSPYIKIYKNAIEGSMVDPLTAPINTNGNYRIGAWEGNTWWLNGGNISSAKIYNRALSSTEIATNYNATKNRFIFQKVNYVLSSGLSITGNGTDEVTIRRESGTTGWNAHAYSTEGFTAPCTIEFYKYAETSDNGVSYAMIGWNADPTANTSYNTLDWAAYPYRTDNYSVYHNGGQVHFGTAWDSNKKFYIVYDTDGWIRHYNGSTLLYSVNKGTGGTVYVDTSFYINHPYYNAFHSVKVAKASWNGTTYI